MKKFILGLICVPCFSFSQIVNIPDNYFKSKLLEASALNNIAKDHQSLPMTVDANGDGEIQHSEAAAVYHLDLYNGNAVSLVGLEAFVNLRTLNCEFNFLQSLDVRELQFLEELYCRYNGLQELFVEGLEYLRYLDCKENNIELIDFDGLNSLETLICYDNDLYAMSVTNLTNLKYFASGENPYSSLDVSNLQNLEYLASDHGQLEELNLTGSNNLEYVYVQNNQLLSIDVSHLSNLKVLICSTNQITTVDVRNSPNMDYVTCGSPELQTLIIKNGGEEDIDVLYTTNPIHVCADEFQIEQITEMLPEYGAVGTVDSYCTFAPAGNYNTVIGNVFFDADQNGCSGNNTLLPNIRVDLFSGEGTVSTCTNGESQYAFYPGAGSFDLLPYLENPEYFIINPAPGEVNFADDDFNSETLSFCIAPIGQHTDLEVTILPLIDANPGFDATYRIVYHNKGNQIMNGDLSFQFNDDLLDFVSSSAAPGIQMGLLTWNYTQLMPFETRWIEVTLNVNSPMDSPPVNLGDWLSFTANVNPVTGDETSSDNTFILRQTVVGSYDPNDKTCLEGATVSTNKIGDYLHYLIRFENTGTAPAQNVIIADEIDTDKFDIQSIQVLSLSHDGYARVNNGKLEFIFEGIQLPFDDANNDGFVLFKIKTKNTLVEGDSVSNSANIYFDYNFPIQTNDAVTTFSSLGVAQHSTPKLGVYPNPARDVLNISSTSTLDSFELCDMSGRIVKSGKLSAEHQSVNVSDLARGIYLVKAKTDSGVLSAKWVKE